MVRKTPLRCGRAHVNDQCVDMPRASATETVDASSNIERAMSVRISGVGYGQSVLGTKYIMFRNYLFKTTIRSYRELSG